MLHEVLAETAAFQKKIAAARPEMFRMNADHDTDRAEFEEVYARMQQERRGLARKYVDLTFDLRATMTREEWGKVFAKMARAHGER